MDLSEKFWNSSVEEIKRGYIEEGDNFICLICGQSFEKGLIYRENDTLYEAEKFVTLHVKEKHGEMFEYLVNMNKKFTGISEIQRDYYSSAA